MKTSYGQPAQPEGVFECRIISTLKTNTKDGSKRMVTIDYEIRGDHEQPNKGYLIRYDNVSENMEWKFNRISEALKLPEGEDFDLYDWADKIKQRTLKLRLVAGEKYPVIKGYYPTDISAVDKESPVDDSHIPF